MIRFDPDTHTYWLGNARVPSVTQTLAPLVDLSAIPPATLKRAADRGTAVHYGCELFDQDNLDWESLSDELVPYIAAWEKFRKEHDFTPERIEETIFHAGLFYAGKLDRTGYLEGNRSVIDIKTSKTLYPTVGMQLSAYAEALNVMNRDEPPHTHRYAVQLREDGTYKLEPYTDKTDWPTFVALKTLTNWANKHQQRIRYEPA